MNVRRLALKSLIAAFAIVLASHSRSDEIPQLEKPIDAMQGEKAGQERDDNWLKTTLVWCPAGKFTMGSQDSDKDGQGDEKPAVPVTLTRGCWLGKYEVWQAEWKRAMGTTPWKGKEYVREGANYPATNVSWENATEFCKKLTDAERGAGRLTKGWEYTLPTEAQWEYACRAGSTTQYFFGDDASKLGDYAWWGGIRDHGNTKAEKYAHRVGQKKPNAWGLHDMHGNTWEWCRGWYNETLKGGSDPEDTSGDTYRMPRTKMNEGPGRVSRGGGWSYGASFCRSASRRGDSYDYGGDTSLGFRLALSAVR